MALAEAVIAGADGDVHQVAGQRRGDVEAAVDVAVFGLAVDLPVGTGGGAGDGDALADLDQRRVALGGLDLLAAAGTAVGGATDDADAILAVDLAAAALDLDVAGAGRTIHRIAAAVLLQVLAGIHGDQQAMRARVDLLQDRLQLGIDHQLVAIGGDLAFAADDRLGHRHHVVGGAVVERDHFGARGGRGAENDRRQQRGEQGGAQQGHRRKLRRSGSERLVSQACSKRAWS